MPELRKVWRIGSQWGEIDLIPFFNKDLLAFAGEEVQSQMTSVKAGDIVGITKGQLYVGVAEVRSVSKLGERGKKVCITFQMTF
jgi:hypothetical protein